MELSGKVNLPSVNETKLPDGKKGNLATIKVMREVAHKYKGHPKVRQLAKNILIYYATNSHNYADEACAIGDYVKNKVAYVKDTLGIEQLHSPLTLINQIERGVAMADCDDVALLIATLLLSVGHNPRFRAVRYKNLTGPYNHIYVVDYAKNGASKPYRVVLDAIIKNKSTGFEVPHKSGKEYAV